MSVWLLHALFCLLLIIPWQSIKGIRLLNRLVVRDPEARMAFYRNAVASQWVLALLALSLMWNVDADYVRRLFSVNFTADSLLVAGLSLLVLMTQSPLVPFVRERMETSASMKRALYPIRNILPRSAAEKNLWITVAITAGVCEEILFRGFLFFYAQSTLGLEVAGAIALSSAVFAIGHLYQGNANMLRVGVIGVIFGVVFTVSDNLIWCIALHALLDLGALRMGDLIPADEPVVDAANMDDL